jgi:hypothetical protein
MSKPTTLNPAPQTLNHQLFQQLAPGNMRLPCFASLTPAHMQAHLGGQEVGAAATQEVGAAATQSSEAVPQVKSDWELKV